MFRKIFLGLGVLLTILVMVVWMQPARFNVTRTAKIHAPVNDVFAQVNDLHNWEAWSPWAKLDPDAKNTFDGPAAGVGSSFKWSGNDKVGEGVMTILESKPNEYIKIKLDFIRPMQGTSTTEFFFKDENKDTEVTWAMSGENTFLSKAIHLCMNLDKVVGSEFENGLANLNNAVEKKK